MKLLITLVIVFLYLIPPSYTQENQTISELFTLDDSIAGTENDLLFICRAASEGNPEKKNWKTGILIDYDNKTHQVQGHYDAGSDEMRILLQNQSRTIFPQKIKAIKVGKMIFVPHEFEGQETLTYGYFQVLSSGKINLLKRFENDKGEIVKYFYTRKMEEPAKLIKLNKNSILKSLDDTRTSKYAKDRKLDVKKEEDLILLFNYYNGLN